MYVCRQGGGRGENSSKMCVRLLWMAPLLLQTRVDFFMDLKIVSLEFDTAAQHRKFFSQKKIHNNITPTTVEISL